MRRMILSAVLACALFATAQTASAQTTEVSLRFDKGHTFWVQGTPVLNLVPNSTVMYYGTAPDYDLYKFGNVYYINNGSTWYQADVVGGPYKRVNYNKIPRELTVVPVDYRRYEVRPNGKDPWTSRWKVEKVK